MRYRLGRGTRVFAQTSDDFFARHDLTTLFGGLALDLAFIDGMHHFEVALRDFTHLERSSHSSTTVLIHDCLPVDEVSAARDRTTVFWTGEIWRLILALRTWRPELDVVVVDWPPSGVGLVRGLDPDSRLLSDHYEEIVEQFLAVPYGSLDDGTKHQQLNCVPGDWDHVRSLLPERPFRRTNVEALALLRTAEAAVHAHHRRIRGPRASGPAGQGADVRTG